MKNRDLKQQRKAFFFLFLSCILLVALDQWTKYLAVLYLKEKNPIIIIKGVFELSYLENRGAAFGLFQNHRYIFLCTTIIIMAGVLYVYWKIPKNKHFLPLQFIGIGVFSGAIGNMIDRLLHGYVVDFFYFSLIDFPVFNVADVYVTVSVAFLVVFLIFFYKEEEFSFLSR
ncbi:MAG: signal peptidase II [Lachnospiraceae bacterium]|nr:signal peptidase II [Lachnospiraceae bacterium]